MDGTWGTNLLTGGSAHSALVPNGVRARRHGVMILPGLGGQAEALVPGEDYVVELVEGHGFCAVSYDVDELWGTAAQRTRLAEARTDTIAAGFIPSAPVHLLGVSMGTCAAAMFAANNPTLVRSLTLILPAVDIQAIYDADLFGLQSSIATAYGGRPSDAETPANAINTAVLAKLPMRVYYSQDDPICTVAESEAFIAATGAEAVDWGTLGYGFPVGHGVHIDYQDGDEFAAWIARND